MTLQLRLRQVLKSSRENKSKETQDFLKFPYNEVFIMVEKFHEFKIFMRTKFLESDASNFFITRS